MLHLCLLFSDIADQKQTADWKLVMLSCSNQDYKTDVCAIQSFNGQTQTALLEIIPEPKKSFSSLRINFLYFVLLWNQA